MPLLAKLHTSAAPHAPFAARHSVLSGSTGYLHVSAAEMTKQAMLDVLVLQEPSVTRVPAYQAVGRKHTAQDTKSGIMSQCAVAYVGAAGVACDVDACTICSCRVLAPFAPCSDHQTCLVGFVT
jgi:hypothetical protein